MSGLQPIVTSTYTPDFHLHELRWAEDMRSRILFDRLYDDKGALWCELTVELVLGELDAMVIPPSRTNLLNATRSGWRGYLEVLEERYDAIEWESLMRQVVGATITAFREGEAAVPLAWEPAPSTEPEPYTPFIIEPLVASSGVTVLYAEGGVGKSLLGLAACMAVSTGFDILGQLPTEVGPTIYFDYEDDPDLHERRLAGLMKGVGLTSLRFPIVHKRLVAKVAQAQTEMRKLVASTGAKLAVLDSIGMGRGGDANAAEDTIRLFRALRSLGIPILALDHVSSQDLRTGDLIKPYGSIYTINSARLLWGARLLSASTDRTKRIQLVNTKANHVRKQEPLAVEVAWVPDDIDEQAFKVVTIAVLDEMWEEFKLTSWEQVYRVLKVEDRWMTSLELADETGLAKSTVLQELSRHDDELDVKPGGGRGNPKTVRLKVNNPDRKFDM